MPVPMSPERMMVRQYLTHVRDARHHGVEGADLHRLLALLDRHQQLREAEGADQRRNELDAAGEIAHAEREALVRVLRLLPDRGDEEAGDAGDPALERVVAGERAGDDHAEESEPEELVGAELQREVAEHRREERERHHADQRAEHRAGGGDAHRAAGQALARERMAVEARRGGRRGAGDVEQDGRAASRRRWRPRRCRSGSAAPGRAAAGW